MAPQRGLYFHVCQSSSIPAQGGHKYTFMPPREILKGAVCPSPVWTRLAIFLIDDGGGVWRTPRRVPPPPPPSHLFGSFTFEHNSCPAVFMWASDSSAVSGKVQSFREKSDIHFENSFEITGSLFSSLFSRLGFLISRASFTHKDVQVACICK